MAEERKFYVWDLDTWGEVDNEGFLAAFSELALAERLKLMIRVQAVADRVRRLTDLSPALRDWPRPNPEKLARVVEPAQEPASTPPPAPPEEITTTATKREEFVRRVKQEVRKPADILHLADEADGLVGEEQKVAVQIVLRDTARIVNTCGERDSIEMLRTKIGVLSRWRDTCGVGRNCRREILSRMIEVLRQRHIAIVESEEPAGIVSASSGESLPSSPAPPATDRAEPVSFESTALAEPRAPRGADQPDTVVVDVEADAATAPADQEVPVAEGATEPSLDTVTAGDLRPEEVPMGDGGRNGGGRNCGRNGRGHSEGRPQRDPFGYASERFGGYRRRRDGR